MAEDQTSREILEQLAARIEHLERMMQAQTTRLYAVERRMGIEPMLRRRPLYDSLKDEREEERGQSPTAALREAAQPPDAGEAREGAATTTPNGGQTQTRPEAGYGAGASYRPRAEAPKPAASPAAKPRDLESLIGGSIFSWAGIILVAFAAAFALKYAFDNDWISPAVRVSLGAVAGSALLVVAERLRRKGLRPYAYVLSGGGVLILYLSVYAAYDFYKLLSQPGAFLLMTAVTALAVLLSVRLNALPVAVLGLVGGFLTPVLLATGQDNQIGLFTYVSLLDAGVLAVAYFKRWRVLDFLSFAATTLMTLGWAFKYYDKGKLWTTLLFVSLYFVVYSLLSFFHNVLPRRRSRWFDVALLVTNATVYFGFCYAMWTDAGYLEAAPATQAMLVAAFFAALFYAARTRSRDDRLLVYAYVGAAVTFLTAAVAIRLELQWVTIVWAVEGLMLTWAGLRAGEPAARRAAFAVFVVAFVHWLGFDAMRFGFDPQTLAAGGDSFVPLLNARALSCLALVSALAGASWLYRGHAVAGEAEGEGRGVLDESERAAAVSLYTLAANGLALTLLTLDLSDYFGRQKALSEGLARDRAEGARQFSLTALWSIYGAGLITYGARRGLRAARYAGVALLTLATAKALALDLRDYDAVWHVPLLNHTFMAFALLVAAYAVAVRLFVRDGSPEEERASALVMVAVANGLALVALSAEAVGYFDRMAPAMTGAGVLDEWKAFSLTVVWTLYGAGAFLYGARRRARGWRFGGLLLLVLTVMKVFVWDVRYYDAPWHAPVLNQTLASFALLVAALWLVAHEYARALPELDEGEKVLPVVTVVANVLALAGLSLEAVGYFRSRMGGEQDAIRLRDLELAKQLSLSVIWAVYGAGLLLAGRVRRVRLLRLMALALLGLTTLKVFLLDLSALDRAYRIVSFIVLGAILLAVSYLYQKSQQRAAAEAAEAEDVPPAPDTSEAVG
ncbi:MAG: DUF2339 domain-containing protein [Pyrinomonadaceae bacterium]